MVKNIIFVFHLILVGLDASCTRLLITRVQRVHHQQDASRFNFATPLMPSSKENVPLTSTRFVFFYTMIPYRLSIYCYNTLMRTHIRGGWSRSALNLTTSRPLERSANSVSVVQGKETWLWRRSRRLLMCLRS